MDILIVSSLGRTDNTKPHISSQKSSCSPTVKLISTLHLEEQYILPIMERAIEVMKEFVVSLHCITYDERISWKYDMQKKFQKRTNFPPSILAGSSHIGFMPFLNILKLKKSTSLLAST